MLPTISDPHDSCSGAKSGEERLAMAVKALSRSASQPAVFPPNKLLEKRIKQLTKGSGLFAGGSGSQKQEDDLDIIKQIIETDVTVSSAAESCTGSVETLRSQSLSHIPGQFPQTAGSLPSLLHAENMHVMHVNYNSAPDFMQFGKSCMSNFDGTTPMGLEGGEMGHLLRRDSQQTPFPGDNFQSPSGYSSLTSQEDLMGGPSGGKELDGMNASRRNSTYESHSAAGTPVLVNDGTQSTPGLPFDLPHLRNSHLPGYGDLSTENRNSPSSAAAFGAGPSKKWVGQPSAGIPNLPSTFHYIVSGSDESVAPGSSKVGGVQGEEGTVRDDKTVGNTALLSDYLVGGGVEVGAARQGEVAPGTKQSKGGGGLELLPSSLKGMSVMGQ